MPRFEDLPASTRERALNEFRPASFLVASIAERNHLDAELERCRDRIKRDESEIGRIIRRAAILDDYLATYDPEPNTKTDADYSDPIPAATVAASSPTGTAAAVTTRELPAVERGGPQGQKDAASAAAETASPPTPEGVDLAPVSPSPESLTNATTGNAANSSASAEREPEDKDSEGTAGRVSQVGGAEPRASVQESGGEQSSPAPTLVSRLRNLHAEHPEFTTAEVAAALSVPRDKVQSNSAANKIKWARETDRRVNLAGRVIELHRQHRDWPATRIAAELDCEPEYVRATASRKELILPSERGYVQDRKPASAHPPAPAPEPIQTPERPPAPIRPPVASIPSGTGSAIVTKPMQRAPKGTRFYLRDDAGLFLHYGCENMTSDKSYAWTGTADQLLACRQKYPLARDLSERPVPRETIGTAA